MKASLYQIYRPKVKVAKYSPPFFALTDDAAIKCLMELAKTTPELCNSYIYRVGSFDTNTGKIVISRNRELIKGKEKK